MTSETAKVSSLPTTMATIEATTGPGSAQPASPVRTPPPKFVEKGTELDCKGDSVTFLSGIHEALGTSDKDLICTLFSQAINAVPTRKAEGISHWNSVAAALHGIHPQDTLEGVLAVQMVTVHNLAMEFLRRASLKEQPPSGVDLNVNRATKLLRTFTAQTEALNRYRGKGEQRMVVKHVHVHNGGQAIVGPVTQTNNRNEGDNETTPTEERQPVGRSE